MTYEDLPASERTEILAILRQLISLIDNAHASAVVETMNDGDRAGVIVDILKREKIYAFVHYTWAKPGLPPGAYNRQILVSIGVPPYVAAYTRLDTKPINQPLYNAICGDLLDGRKTIDIWPRFRDIFDF